MSMAWNGNSIMVCFCFMPFLTKGDFYGYFCRYEHGNEDRGQSF